MFSPPPSAQYSRLLTERILSPRNVGAFAPNAFANSEMRVVVGRWEREEKLALYLVIDETDGIIADAKFQAIGKSDLIGAADAGCDALLRKNHEQARRLTVDLIDRVLRDFASIPAFPEQAAPALNAVLEAIDLALEGVQDIVITDPSYTPPVPIDLAATGEYPGFEELTEREKLAVINQVIAADIQPYIELDAGGIEVLSLKNKNEVIIAYQGACTSCPSATGATLNAIEQILRAKVNPNLTVKPDLSFLSP